MEVLMWKLYLMALIMYALRGSLKYSESIQLLWMSCCIGLLVM
ncbi:hypothetical protein PSYAC_27106 [Pseudomonas syringae pv. actinidiae str. M302091]|nr:hypothetical protein PSYAC_27106 [Pseudomonas syringae pv. actinidiae str. M302091]